MPARLTARLPDRPLAAPKPGEGGTARRLLRIAALAALAAITSASRADVVWTAGQGWTIEGGALSGLNPSEAKSALDLMNSAKRLEDRGSYHTSARYYERVATRYPNSVYSPEALYRAAHAYLMKKEYFKAFETYQKTLAFYPNSSRFNEILGEEFRISGLLLDGARNRIIRGSLPGFRNPERAIGYFEQIIASAPASDYAPIALMNVADAHLKYDNVEEAIDSLNRLINTYPNNLLTPDAYLKLGHTHADLVVGPEYDQADTREAITYLTDFLIRFRDDEHAPEAEKTLAAMKSSLAQSKIKIGDFYFYGRSNVIAARVFYNEAITANPGSTDEKQARARLVEVEAKAAGKPIPRGSDNTTAAPTEKKKKRFLFF